MQVDTFTARGVITLLLVAGLGVALSLRLLARRKFTMPYAIVWIGAFGGLAVIVAMPQLLRLASRLLGTQDPLGAVRLLALIAIAGFLLFFSVKVSVLTHRFEELTQRLALIEHTLDERIDARDDEAARKGA